MNHLVGIKYSKTARKNGKHAAITDSSSISAITSLGVQIHENHTANYFSATPRVILNNYYFQLVPSIRFIVAIPSAVDLKSQTTHLVVAIKAVNSAKGGGDDDSGDEVQI
ncbi:hypothetical protein BDQ17DRAFT_1425321 [Cyathus striatus]|nr:hypothetical protein BDQ17DRAFT_1425321 [Cyathus striatus]